MALKDWKLSIDGDYTMEWRRINPKKGDATIYKIYINATQVSVNPTKYVWNFYVFGDMGWTSEKVLHKGFAREKAQAIKIAKNYMRKN